MSKSGLGLVHLMESLEQQKARQGTRTQTRVVFLLPLSKAVALFHLRAPSLGSDKLGTEGTGGRMAHLSMANSDRA